MQRLTWLSALVLSVVFVTEASAQKIKPITPIKGVRATKAIMKEAKRGKPLVVKTKADAKKYFGEKSFAKVAKAVDFKKQHVLVFYWRGSGQDKLKYDVAESFPEQITFRIIPGRTRDLRPHFYVFALRSNVKWSVKRGR